LGHLARRETGGLVVKVDEPLRVLVRVRVRVRGRVRMRDRDRDRVGD
jgi:hypothetical protein